jgi:hypothetical protein
MSGTAGMVLNSVLRIGFMPGISVSYAKVAKSGKKDNV